jgi:hypothetical protein
LSGGEIVMVPWVAVGGESAAIVAGRPLDRRITIRPIRMPPKRANEAVPYRLF